MRLNVLFTGLITFLSVLLRGFIVKYFNRVVVLKYDYPTLYVHATQYTCTPNNVIKVKEKNLLKRTNVLKHEGRLISFDSG